MQLLSSLLRYAIIPYVWPTICFFSVLSAGPQANFRMEKGAIVRGEVLYADNHYYYCRRVFPPEGTFTVEVSSVPIDLRRSIDAMRMSGEIKPPPVPRQPPSYERGSSKRAMGKWRLDDNTQKADNEVGEIRRIKPASSYENGSNGQPASKLIYLEGVTNVGTKAILIIRQTANLSSVYIHYGFEIGGLDFWPVDYRIDGGEVKSRRWSPSRAMTSLFCPYQGPFKEELKGGKSLLFKTQNLHDKTIIARFDITGIDQALIALGEGL